MTMGWRLRIAIVFLFGHLLLVAIGGAQAEEKSLPVAPLTGARREPVAAARLRSPLVAIACAKSGTLIIWDWQRGEIQQEFAVGKELRGALSIGADQLLLLDGRTNELIQVWYTEGKLIELRRYSLPSYPVAMCQWGDAERTYVAVTSLWARQVTIWRTPQWHQKSQDTSEFKLVEVIDLPFEPRLISTVQQSRRTFLQVADAFGGSLAEIDAENWRVRTWQQPIHNIGSLVPHGFSYYITHQALNSRLPTTASNLTSGELLQNRLAHVTRGEPINRDNVLKLRPNAEQVEPLGADPAGIGALNRFQLVCLAGTDEVAVLDNRWNFVKRVPVGRRPRAVVNLDDSHALVLGELDDSISLFNASDVQNDSQLDKLKVSTKSLHPAAATRELSPAERGERLFFSAKNSAGQRMSCHSCHPDGHTNGLLADTLGDNTHGTPKRVLTLRGTRLTDLWAWNGEMRTLQDNVHKSLQDTMHATKINPADVDDLVSFLHTLPPVPPLKPVPADQADSELVARGKQIFQREACDQCHVPPLTYTSHASYDVGLVDEKGLKKFNPPSLRGVGRLQSLLHDNRASSLRDVFETHGHQLKEPLPAAELQALVRFLQSL